MPRPADPLRSLRTVSASTLRRHVRAAELVEPRSSAEGCEHHVPAHNVGSGLPGVYGSRWESERCNAPEKWRRCHQTCPRAEPKAAMTRRVKDTREGVKKLERDLVQLRTKLKTEERELGRIMKRDV